MIEGSDCWIRQLVKYYTWWILVSQKVRVGLKYLDQVKLEQWSITLLSVASTEVVSGMWNYSQVKTLWVNIVFCWWIWRSKRRLEENLYSERNWNCRGWESQRWKKSLLNGLTEYVTVIKISVVWKKFFRGCEWSICLD